MALRYCFIRMYNRNLSIKGIGKEPEKEPGKEPEKELEKEPDKEHDKKLDNILYDYSRMINGDNNNNIP